MIKSKPAPPKKIPERKRGNGQKREKKKGHTHRETDRA
jgi:hypothetical protein